MLLAACAQQPERPIRGADLGWLSEMEHDSVAFYNDGDEAVDCIELMQAAGMEAVRLRVWVNHQTGWCNLPDVLAMAERVQRAGLPLMIDLHYSDYWADPQTQTIPAWWQDLNLHELALAVNAHTTEVLETLKSHDITPRWIQIGNETTNGMLWPMGALDRQTIYQEAFLPTDSLGEMQDMWRHYALLSNAGYDAAKQVFPAIICITHVDNAFIPRVNWFRRFQEAGGKWDMVGLSHYPFTQDTLSWQEMNRLCQTNVAALHEAFGCPVMITEVGVKTEWQPEESLLCLQDFRARMDTTAGYAGVFYWEPEVYGGWRPQEYIPLGWGAYDMGCMTPDGHLSNAFKALFQ